MAKLSHHVGQWCLTFSLLGGNYCDRSRTGTGEVATQATGHLQSISYFDDVCQTLCERPTIYIKVFHGYMSDGFRPPELRMKFPACSSYNSLLNLPTCAAWHWRTLLFGLYWQSTQTDGLLVLFTNIMDIPF